ncbi:Endoplasmic reticulum vesicle protein 25 like [Verticillium longisporum]|nr:Endoplasmic reticulum vesicle protein 25 like [Verticillium longisporum]
MALPRSLLHYVCSLLLLAVSAQALKFDLHATAPGASNRERCIRNFVAKETLVVVTATVGGYKGDGMTVNMRIKDAVGNDYGRPKDVAGEQRTVFTSHADAAFDVCFENVFSDSRSIPNAFVDVELDIDIGADAKDWSAIQATEKLKPVEAELRRIEELISEALVPLCKDIIGDFVALEEESQHRNILAWRPVVVDVLEGYAAFPEEAFEGHVKEFYPMVVELLGKNLSSELRAALLLVLRRVGEVGLGIEGMASRGGDKERRESVATVTTEGEYHKAGTPRIG